jgi:hypothetical protein
MRLAFAFVCAVLASVSIGSSALAQQPLRLRGPIERLAGNVLTVKLEDSGEAVIKLADNVALFAVAKATLADLTPGAFIGVGAMPQADGSQRAIQVTLFAESQRGLGEGFRPWDRGPTSTMTNATVATTVGGVDGQVLTVKYKDGEKRIIVPPEATIVAYAVADRSELKPGAAVAVVNPKKNEDGSYDAGRVTVGRGGVVPR